jgi:hypothetical protein
MTSAPGDRPVPGHLAVRADIDQGRTGPHRLLGLGGGEPVQAAPRRFSSSWMVIRVIVMTRY